MHTIDKTIIYHIAWCCDSTFDIFHWPRNGIMRLRRAERRVFGDALDAVRFSGGTAAGKIERRYRDRARK